MKSLYYCKATRDFQKALNSVLKEVNPEHVSFSFENKHLNARLQTSIDENSKYLTQFYNSVHIDGYSVALAIDTCPTIYCHFAKSLLNNSLKVGIHLQSTKNNKNHMLPNSIISGNVRYKTDQYNIIGCLGLNKDKSFSAALEAYVLQFFGRIHTITTSKSNILEGFAMRYPIGPYAFVQRDITLGKTLAFEVGGLARINNLCQTFFSFDVLKTRVGISAVGSVHDNILLAVSARYRKDSLDPFKVVLGGKTIGDSSFCGSISLDGTLKFGMKCMPRDWLEIGLRSKTSIKKGLLPTTFGFSLDFKY